MTTLVAKSSGGQDFELPEPGTHLARCYRILDLGTRKSEYQGKIDFKRTINVGWELPNSTLDNGAPHVVGQYYTLSTNPKSKLRPVLESWLGRNLTRDEEAKGFDLISLLGKPCMLNIVHKEKQNGYTKADVTGVMSAPAGTDMPPQYNESVLFSLDDFDKETFEKIPEGLQAMIKESPEYRKVTGQKPAQQAAPESPPTPKQAPKQTQDHGEALSDDEIPF